MSAGCPFQSCQENSDHLLSSGMTSGQFLSSEGFTVAGYCPAVPGRAERTAGGSVALPGRVLACH